MRILTFCDADGSNIAQRLGTPEYSYHFVLEAFHDALARFAQVQRIHAPESEADAIWKHCREHGEACVLLTFTPPHKTIFPQHCPTIPVFAWEYPDLPAGGDEESWHDDPRHDWPRVFLKAGAAITLSSHTARAVHDSLGESYPILAVPTPLWEKFTPQRERGVLPPQRGGVEICLNAVLVDSDLMGLSADALDIGHPDDGTPSEPETDALLPELATARSEDWLAGVTHDRIDELAAPVTPCPAGGDPPVDAGWDLPPAFDVRTTLHGVVYTAVITPSDGRKNWEDLITAFCWAFRETADATLVLKLSGTDQLKRHCQMLMLLTKLSPMKCRVIALRGYLDDDAYNQLIGASTYYVNASLCEGLCMPLMEFLCCGVPAIAPDHTSMADYIHPDFAFVVDSSPGLPGLWPHGDHQIYRTSRHQINWHSLMLSYRRSYLMAKTAPDKYASMSAHAIRHMRAYCGIENIARELHNFLNRHLQETSQTSWSASRATAVL